MVEGDDQLFIVQDVIGGLRHELKDLALDLLELSLEVAELHDELVLLLLELWLLIGDDIDQELVLKAIWRDCKVDHSNLDTDLRQVMRVRKLGRDDQPEVHRVRHPSISQSNLPCASLLYHILLQHRFQRRVKCLVDVLEEDRLTQPDTSLNHLQELWIRKLGSLDVGVFLHVLDPFVTLRLRVNEKRPPLCLRADDAIFKREGICWKSLDVPFPYLYWIT